MPAQGLTPVLRLGSSRRPGVRAGDAGGVGGEVDAGADDGGVGVVEQAASTSPSPMSIGPRRRMAPPPDGYDPAYPVVVPAAPAGGRSGGDTGWEPLATGKAMRPRAGAHPWPGDEFLPS